MKSSSFKPHRGANAFEAPAQQPNKKEAKPRQEEEGEEEEEDYMSMTFTDTPSSSITKSHHHSHQPPETSLQRRHRERREAEARARPKSKAELAAEADARREAALATSLLDRARTGNGAAAPPSKGLAMMAKMGFRGGALGVSAKAKANSVVKEGEEKQEEGEESDGRLVEPLRVTVRDGREGIGLESERKRKMREAAEQLGEAAKRVRVDEGEYRDRVRREREAARLEKLVVAAQKVAERMDDEEDGESAGGGEDAADGNAIDEDGKIAQGRRRGTKRRSRMQDGGGLSARPLRSIPVVWRGLVRAREEAERDRRMRHDLEQGLSRLPTYEDGDEEEDADDRIALGKSAPGTVFAASEDLDEEDAELDEFNALEADEKLRRLVEHLRTEHNYCFWCKFAYPDEKMEGCPGVTEEDHD